MPPNDHQTMLDRTSGDPFTSHNQKPHKDIPFYTPQTRCHSLLSKILEDAERWPLVRELSEDAAQLVANYLDIVARDVNILNAQERRRALALLYKLAKSAQVFPQRCQLTRVKFRGQPVSRGSFANIYKEKYGDRMISIKAFRVHKRVIKICAPELTLWAHLQHKNILPFYGVCLLGAAPCLVSPWMEKGNVRDYLKQFPEKSRLPFISDILDGLSYLHSLQIVHGDLRVENILVSDDEQALITDFGLSSVAAGVQQGFVSSNGGTRHWMAPELLTADGEVQATKFSDIWSFACLCYKIVTNKEPFYQYEGFQVVSAMARKEIPLGPESDIAAGREEIDNRLWALLVNCWNYTSEDRPTCETLQESIAGIIIRDSRSGPAVGVEASSAFREGSNAGVDYVRMEEIFLRISSLSHPVVTPVKNGPESSPEVRNDSVSLLDLADPPTGHHPELPQDAPFPTLQSRCHSLLSKVLGDAEQRALVCELSEDDAQLMADYLDMVVHGVIIPQRRRALALLCKLARNAQVFPRSYELRGVECGGELVGSGGFANVYKGKYRSETVCLKVFHAYQKPQENERIVNAGASELTLWAHLRHKNVLPFYGVYFLGGTLPKLCLVSPWMEKGNLRDYLAKFPEKPRMPLISDILNGLSYLHDLQIVHNDLKAENILISDNGLALITDFGVSSIAAASRLMSVTSHGGTPRWMAPELLITDGEARATKSCDIWSFACLCYQALANKVPFYQYKDYQMLAAMMRKETPLRPELDATAGPKELSNQLWDLLMKCWNYTPKDRPSCETLQDSIAEIGLQDDQLGAAARVGAGSAFREGSNARVDYARVEEILLQISPLSNPAVTRAGNAPTSLLEPEGHSEPFCTDGNSSPTIEGGSALHTQRSAIPHTGTHLPLPNKARNSLSVELRPSDSIKTQTPRELIREKEQMGPDDEVASPLSIRKSNAEHWIARVKGGSAWRGLKRITDPGKWPGAAQIQKTSTPTLRKRAPITEGHCRTLVLRMIHNREQRLSIEKLQGVEAQLMADYLNIILHAKLPDKDWERVLSILLKLAKYAKVYPRCYELGAVQYDDSNGKFGTFADVYRGVHGGKVICLKIMRFASGGRRGPELMKMYLKELVLWAHLSHRNILPFYGLYRLAGSSRLCLVSPWMGNGTLHDYAKRRTQSQRKLWLSDILDGLSYLHKKIIVHGDLKGVNILISDDERALIADFGSSYVAMTSVRMASSNGGLGTIRWAAPELFNPVVDPSKPNRQTQESDIWSFGCTCYEILAGELPFSQYGPEHWVLAALQKGNTFPERPQTNSREAIDDDLWALMMSCWNYKPGLRPTCQVLRDRLTELGICREDDKPVAAAGSNYSFWEAVREKSNIEVDYDAVEKILLRVQESTNT